MPESTVWGFHCRAMWPMLMIKLRMQYKLDRYRQPCCIDVDACRRVDILDNCCFLWRRSMRSWMCKKTIWSAVDDSLHGVIATASWVYGQHAVDGHAATWAWSWRLNAAGRHTSCCCCCSSSSSFLIFAMEYGGAWATGRDISTRFHGTSIQCN